MNAGKIFELIATMSEEDLKTLKATQLDPLFKKAPLVIETLKEALSPFAPEFKAFYKSGRFGIAEVDKEVFDYYLTQGFTRTEAFELLLNNKMRIESLMKSIQKPTKKGA